MKINSILNTEELAEKARRWCSYQERCQYEVVLKLKSWGATSSQLEKVCETLISEGFIDDQRFARMYASGKFRNNYWGKLKITAGLRSKNIDNTLIQEALGGIDEDEYLQIIKKLVLRKGQITGLKNYADRMKIAAYMASKGFESHLIMEIINNIKS
ncbi:MAG: regulatory protein RecX [Bacteroidales bacterium]|nr:regulatory protein RecX [Bacteroidales bacterium]